MRRLIAGLTMTFALWIPPCQAQDSGIESLRQTGKAFSTVARKVAPSVAWQPGA